MRFNIATMENTPHICATDSTIIANLAHAISLVKSFNNTPKGK